MEDGLIFINFFFERKMTSIHFDLNKKIYIYNHILPGNLTNKTD
jgi:hypothetical protein